MLRLHCARLEDRVAISAAAIRFARRIGFTPRACWEIGITVQELVSNLVRHAGGGYLELQPSPCFLDVIAIDRGPGIPEVKVRESATSERGLGAVRRLMHELEICCAETTGTQVRARRYMDRK